MKFPVRPRVVISGAGSGLGKAIALVFAKRNARVLVLDINEVAAKQTAALIEQAGGEAVALKCDVGSMEDWQHARDTFGPADILVNNAGVAAGGRIGDMPIADWEWLLRINLQGVINGCHAFVPGMREQKRGFVLNIASSGGIANLPFMAAYNVSKAAVISLSETLHAESGADGVQVSVVCPTFFRTNLMDSFRGGDEVRKLAHSMFKLSLATAEQVAEISVRGLERGQLLIIPQIDGRMLWRFKRLAPALYHRFVRLSNASARVQRWLGDAS